MTTAITITENQTLAELARSGSGSARVKVLGYWSSDSITIYLRRRTHWNTTAPGFPERSHEWKIDITHSSGGRDTKEVPCDTDAEENFGRALIESARFGRDWLKQIDILEQGYQAARAAEQAAIDAEAAAKQARIDADPALGDARAAALLAALRARAATAPDGGNGYNFGLARRGATDNTPVDMVRAEFTRSGAVRWLWNGQSTKASAVRELVAASSTRNTI